MNHKSSSTIRLEKHIDHLNSQLLNLDEERTKLIRDLDSAQKALAASLQERGDVVYRKDDTLREKILYCFHKVEIILSISAVGDMLVRTDRELGNSYKNLSQAIRLQMAKMIEDRQVVQYKLPQMKTMHYALQEWTDDLGEIRERYFGQT